MKPDDLLGILLAVAMLAAFGLLAYGLDWFIGLFEPKDQEYIDQCRNRLRDTSDKDVVASMRKWEGQ